MTGYTHELVEKKLTFPQFAMKCARAFGACIEMRDDSWDAEIPQEFKPSSYHSEQVVKAQQEYDKLRNMTEKQRVAFGKREKAGMIRRYKQSIREEQKQNQILSKMIAKVQQWEPPTPEHEGIKKFMLEQLEMSLMKDSFFMRELKQVQKADPLTIHKEALSHAKWEVDYHIKGQVEEEERAKRNTEWIKQLRASLK